MTTVIYLKLKINKKSEKNYAVFYANFVFETLSNFCWLWNYVEKVYTEVNVFAHLYVHIKNTFSWK